MQKKKEVRVKAKSNNNCRNICKGKQNKNKKKENKRNKNYNFKNELVQKIIGMYQEKLNVLAHSGIIWKLCKYVQTSENSQTS